ncbi:ABC-three component system middle component 1 [Klebsiella pneumoniae]|uniref:ABC-three component system middle component 1 n=1 Tax=Klebsiella pneumoniae TaxID=573 RepID=UPI002542D514|nr:ABC-three component system middle component 1 [Klebsiella pneumoniae]WII49975.1 hypothetical protein N5862_13090 [Klebsiella pneumoniae]WII50483.1 hypothetical protein N5862_26525 [Klebsiella pneumoniae]
MIKDIVLQAALKHEFTLFNTGDYSKADDVTIEYSAGETLAGLEGVDYKSLTYFSQDSGDRKRFLAVVECENIPSPQVLNKLVLLYAPETFKSDPAFDKNTDLIILHKLRHRADFNGIESKVFGIEENPYYFKKYFLYYSEEELRLLEGHNFESVSAIVVDDRMFAEYRDQPLSPTLYSVAARIFIKLPFVKVPVKESSLKPLDIYVKEALAEKKLTGLHLKIFNASASGIEADKLIETLIHEKMENIQPQD